ncbi:multi-sensor signal transduction histidine kinase [Tolypothrix sp. NIES-4075]|uniref:general stress protein n=1 Tax=Tolypothrix sp. NIES-4075 TaxID=2005459 RepID=UPI000B5C5863|nr:general stress protein [Tolypothrix sp. NIES-4075]GAX41083.1 multi-sensor signal transduction histidine kinase [Tolypothrix sp. NIES-4075]
MALGTHKRAVGVFSSRRDAEHALTELRDVGFNMGKISIIAKDGDRHDDIAGVETQKRVGNKADEGVASGAVTGTVLGGITGLLVGLGTLAIPGVGPILLAGEVASTLATAAAGAGIGAAAGGLLGALAGLGVPEERAKIYSDRVSRGDYLLIVDGSEEEIYRAESVLQNQRIQEFGIYNAPGMARDADYLEPANRVVDSIGISDDDSKVIIVDRRDGSI